MAEVDAMPGSRKNSFSSAVAAIIATAGVAVGLGNIWRFPYMMGMFGGAAFLLLYLLIVISFGIPALMAEWALGRATGRGPLGAYRAAGMPGGRSVGGLLFVTVAMAAAYYAVVLGWVVYSAAIFVAGGPAEPAAHFDGLLASPIRQFVCTAIAMAAAAGGVFLGVRGGIERASRYGLPLFFVMFAVLAVRVVTLPGAEEGIRYYLLPRWEQLKADTLLAAMGQACFSLGLGGTFMVMYGSYLPGSIRPRTAAAWTALTDAGAAVMGGLVVVPAVFVTGLELASGPPLMFQVMPQVLLKLPAGAFFGSLFFLSVFLVGTLSLMANFEILVVGLERWKGWGRRSILGPLFAIQLLLAIPAMVSLDYLLYSDLFWGTTMQPVGAALAVIALTWCLGRARAMKEAGISSTLLYYWIRYAIPSGITATLLYGWLTM